MPDIITVLLSTIKRERVCFNVLTGTSFLLSPAAARRHGTGTVRRHSLAHPLLHPCLVTACTTAEQES